MNEKSRRETSGFFFVCASSIPGPVFLPGGGALAGPGGYKLTGGLRRPGQAQPPPGTKAAPRPLPLPGNMLATETTAGRFPLPPGEVRVRESTAGKSFMLSVASAGIALPVSLLRYVSHGAGSAQGAASRRRPLYPRAPASKIAATRYLRLIPASGRAEAASMQNTALSPHPCGLPRPSGNVSAILRPPAPAVSVTQVGKSRTGRTNPVGRVRRQPPPGTKAAPRPLPLPGGAALAGPTVLNNLLIYKWLCRSGKRSATRQIFA